MDKVIYIVDDNSNFLQSTAWWLEGAGYQVEGFGNPALALEYICGLDVPKYSCLLLDVRMPEMSGLDFHEQLKNRGVHLPIIYMTGHGDIALAVKAMRKGAITFLEKPLDDELLVSALDAVFSMQGMRLESEANQTETAFMERYTSLTPREKEVMQYIVDGKMNKVIAEEMGISIRTSELHRSRVMKKMKASSITALIKMALTGRVL